MRLAHEFLITLDTDDQSTNSNLQGAGVCRVFCDLIYQQLMPDFQLCFSFVISKDELTPNILTLSFQRCAGGPGVCRGGERPPGWVYGENRLWASVSAGLPLPTGFHRQHLVSSGPTQPRIFLKTNLIDLTYCFKACANFTTSQIS